MEGSTWDEITGLLEADGCSDEFFQRVTAVYRDLPAVDPRETPSLPLAAVVTPVDSDAGNGAVAPCAPRSPSAPHSSESTHTHTSGTAAGARGGYPTTQAALRQVVCAICMDETHHDMVADQFWNWVELAVSWLHENPHDEVGTRGPRGPSGQACQRFTVPDGDADGDTNERSDAAFAVIDRVVECAGPREALLPLRYFIEKDDAISVHGWARLLQTTIHAAQRIERPKSRRVHIEDTLTAAAAWVRLLCPDAIALYSTCMVGADGGTQLDGELPVAAARLRTATAAYVDALFLVVAADNSPEGTPSAPIAPSILRACIDALEFCGYLPDTTHVAARLVDSVVDDIAAVVKTSDHFDEALLLEGGGDEGSEEPLSSIGLAMLTLAICRDCQRAGKAGSGWISDMASEKLFAVGVTRASHLVEVDCIWTALRGASLAAIATELCERNISNLHPSPASAFVRKPAQPIAQAVILHMVSCPSQVIRDTLSQRLGEYITALPERLRHQQYRELLTSCPYANASYLLILWVKKEVIDACQTGDGDSWFTGSRFLELALCILKPVDEGRVQTQKLLEDFDRMTALLNFLRFCLLYGGGDLERKVDRNEIGVWNASFLDQVEHGFLKMVAKQCEAAQAALQIQQWVNECPVGPGDAVRLENLVKKPELNGVRGVVAPVAKWKCSRVAVLLETDPTRPVSLNPNNLVVTALAPPGPAISGIVLDSGAHESLPHESASNLGLESNKISMLQMHLEMVQECLTEGKNELV